MKIIGSLDGGEMHQAAPDLMEALESNDPLAYCFFCDGLRKVDHTCRCWICGRSRTECETSGCNGSALESLMLRVLEEQGSRQATIRPE
jgi:hypothetical protein